MSDEGFEDRRRDGEERVQTRNLAEMERPLDGPGSQERLEQLRRKFRSAGGGGGEPMPAGQLLLVGVAVFLIVLMFGAGRYVIAALAPKPPPGIEAQP